MIKNSDKVPVSAEEAKITPKHNFLYRFLIQGRIPGIKWLTWLIYLGVLAVPVLLIFYYQEHTEFASIGWNVLFAVILVRPVADLFPTIGIFRSLMALRRPVGILAGVLLLAHGVGYLLAANISVLSLFTNKAFWGWDNYLTWGILGVLLAIPLVLTSNNFSMRLLKRNWKRLQKLSYLLFIFGGLHVYLIGEEEALIYVLIVAVLWVLTKFHFKIKIPV